MSTEIKVPTLGESVTTATIARWMKKTGDAVAADEPLVELETDKVTVEVNAPGAGTLGQIVAAEGAEVEVGAVLALLEAGGAASGASPSATPSNASPVAVTPSVTTTAGAATAVASSTAANPSPGVNPQPQPLGPVARPAGPPPASMAPASTMPASTMPVPAAAHAPMPSAAKMMEEKGLAAGQMDPGTGKDGRITKGDVLQFLSRPACRARPQGAPRR